MHQARNERFYVRGCHRQNETEAKCRRGALYWCHQFPETEFIHNLKQFKKSNRNVKNRLIIEDFNIEILQLNLNSQEHINSFMEAGFYPDFIGVTRPSDNKRGGSCIGNLFIKTNSIKTRTYKWNNLLTDHFPLFMAIDKIRNKTNTINKPVICFSKLKNIVKTINWLNILSITDPKEATDELILKI